MAVLSSDIQPSSIPQRFLQENNSFHVVPCSHNAKLLSRLKNAADLGGNSVGGKGALLPTQQFGACLEWIREHQVFTLVYSTQIKGED